MRAKLIVAFVFLCAGASVFGAIPYHMLDRLTWVIGAQASRFVFLAAAIAIFWKSRVGYWLGLSAALMALPYFIRSEIANPVSSWLFLNCTGPLEDCSNQTVEFALLALVLVPTSVACGVLRLLPSRWTMRGSPICDRVWPAFLISLVGLGIWYLHSVIPYQVPMFHRPRGGEAVLRMLHVQKRGFYFHETGVFEILRDGAIGASRTDRRWFQYESSHRVGHAMVYRVGLPERGRALVDEAKGWNLHTEAPRALWWWNAEGWYVVTPERRFSFTNGAQPPEEVKELFRDMESVAPSQRIVPVRDACFGFCYDPPAGLGLDSWEAREWLRRAH